MSLVKINELNIPAQAAPAVIKRFEAQIEVLSTVDGFEGFELLRPTKEGESAWFVYTRWADDESYQAWRNSDLFAQSHKGGGPPAAARPEGAEGGHPGGGHPGGKPAGGPPESNHPTLMEFEVAASSGSVSS